MKINHYYGTKISSSTSKSVLDENWPRIFDGKSGNFYKKCNMQICMVLAKKRVFQKDIMQQENDSCKPSILAFPFDTYLYS